LLGVVIFAPPLFAEEVMGDPAMQAEEQFGVAVTEHELDFQRGRNTLTIIEMDLDARLHDNAAVANVTGSNYITGDAFSNVAGFPMVIQNTGNNVIIQNSTILQLEVK